ncbi:MAG: hypothetical protein ACREO7_03960 [Pseudoxanthomonas sp.]
MKTSTYNSWWREMGAISRGMMFIQGHIATSLAVESIDKPLPAPPALASGSSSSKPLQHRRRIPRGLRVKATRFLHDLELLGGRSMLAGHNDDIDEPFPQLHRRRLVASRDSGPSRRGGNLQPETCATC